VLLQNQGAFIHQFITQLFADLDGGLFPGITSMNFNRLGSEIRFRMIGPAGAFPPLVPMIDGRLAAAKAANLIIGFRSEPEGDWETPDSNYGTDVAGVGPAFTQFLESVSRAAVALIPPGGSAVPEGVLWNWLHLVHNTMTGIARNVVEVGSVVRTL